MARLRRSLVGDCHDADIWLVHPDCRASLGADRRRGLAVAGCQDNQLYFRGLVASGSCLDSGGSF